MKRARPACLPAGSVNYEQGQNILYATEFTEGAEEIKYRVYSFLCDLCDLGGKLLLTIDE
jgi:hypothetical protein